MNEEKRILISVISNRKSWPVYFCNSLLNLYIETKKHFKADLMISDSCSIENMRNAACLYALGKNADGIKYDYMVQLDDDHKYPSDMIVKLMKHNKDFVCPLTNRRKPPYTPTQFKKFKQKNLTNPENCIDEKKDGLKEIEVTGVVGALIDTKILKKIEWPFFEVKYFKNDYLKDGIRRRGSDIVFTNKLRKARIKMYCDTDIVLPHELRAFVNRNKFDFPID